MTSRDVEFPGFCLRIPIGWDDLSDYESDDTPFTIADPENGVGAIQITPAVFRAGKAPDISIEDLASMLCDFAMAQGLGTAKPVRVVNDSMLVVRAEFLCADDFIVVWYVSDGTNILLITYVCQAEVQALEREVSESIVRSVKFTG